MLNLKQIPKKKKKIMAKNKVYIKIEGGIVTYCATDSAEIEVVLIDNEKDIDPTIDTNIVHNIFDSKDLEKLINNNWGSILSEFIGEDVDVEAVEDSHGDFQGTLMGVITDKDKMMYASVVDQDGDYFNVDVLKVKLA